MLIGNNTNLLVALIPLCVHFLHRWSYVDSMWTARMESSMNFMKAFHSLIKYALTTTILVSIIFPTLTGPNRPCSLISRNQRREQPHAHGLFNTVETSQPRRSFNGDTPVQLVHDAIGSITVLLYKSSDLALLRSMYTWTLHVSAWYHQTPSRKRLKQLFLYCV